MASRYELQTFSEHTEHNDGESMGYKNSGGCYIKTATGFIIGLLAILIAVGVGLIVHFAENRKFECVFPEGSSNVVIGGSGRLDGTANTNCPTTAVGPTMGGATTTTSSPRVSVNVRLPRDILPNMYDIRIQPEMYGDDPEEFTFHGEVNITLDCSKPTSKVVLHVYKLNVSNVAFSGGGLTSSGWSEDEELQQLTVSLSGETKAKSQYWLSMNFAGPLKDDLKGLYLSTYTEGNETKFWATTQMEPVDARKAFPCFDEPDIKARFRMTLTRKSHLMSISNMPLSETVPRSDGYVDDTYKPSEKMSTYLVAFVVGQFGHLEDTANNTNKLKYGAWARPLAVNYTAEALYVGVNTIVNYENYFGIEFPLPKQDMITIPDFAAGAMENWGLITYRETAMLYTPGVSSEANRQRLSTIITHELGHQWFGDLVTMAWWDDLWLNEGFATYVEYFGTGMLRPDWKMMEQFVVIETQDAFEFDSLKTSHPIYAPVNHPDEINEIFDGISYSKGGSIIRMMNLILGEETFKKGLQNYLKAHEYGNAKHDHLWSALAEQSQTDGHQIDVKAVMDTWTLQMNYPLVKLTIESGKLMARQQRFLKNRDASDPGKYKSDFGYVWQIPLTYITSKNTNVNVTKDDIVWLKETVKDLGSLNLGEDDWLLGNIDQYGFYRVTYSDDNWRSLIDQLKRKHTIIPNINRAQIINDAWSLSRAGDLSTSIALETLEYLDKELDLVPWMAALVQIGEVDDMLRKSELYGNFKTFMQSKLDGPFGKLGMVNNNSTHVESLTRRYVVQLACHFGVDGCVRQSQQLFQEWMDNPEVNKIDPDVRPTVYCAALAEGGSKEWQFMFDKYLTETVVTEKVVLSQALACTRESWLLNKYLELSLQPDIVRKQDATNVINYVSSNPIGEPLAWDFVRGRWDYLHGTYGGGVFSFARLIGDLTSAFNTPFQLQQLKDFLEQYPDMGTGNRAFRQAIEKTEINIKWMDANKHVIADWLKTVGQSLDTRVKDVRLPVHLVPESYDIILQPNMYSGDPENFNFTGYVKVYMKAEGVGKNVTLHSNKIKIDEETIKFGEVDRTSGPKYKKQLQRDEVRQFDIFFLDSTIEKGKRYYIEMNFTGPLIGDLTGLYRSEYKRGNETIYIATTQMEPTDARKAFPCFDEPQLKAIFNVKLARKPHMISISNMPIISTYTTEDGFIVDVFNTSAKMSTYLLAFIICDFEYTENTTKNGVTYRAWSRPESINQTKLALEVGIEVLTHYEEYFGEAFPLPKQDMIAIPDFSAGAMENWGLITYRETAMLYEPGVSTESNKQRVAVVIAHELAHQWFGDLVTMEWWDDLWLNEGFATYVEYLGSDFMFPEWKMFELFVFEIFDVFDIDCLVTSHPIYVPVQNPDEINEIFDTISYAKGGSVIRMMQFFLGEDTFIKGLQKYIKNLKYKNAFHDDLWDSLSEAATDSGHPINVKEILDTWIVQMNYPVVHASKALNGKIKLNQDRFLTNKDAVDPGAYNSPYNYVWKIPFSYTTGSAPNFNVTRDDVIWLNDTESELQDDYPATGWILGNVQMYGVYRVNYDLENWNLLIDQLNSAHTVIGTTNRAQIINDAFGLAKAKMLPMDVALKTLDYLNKETEYVPWDVATTELSYISKMIRDTELYGPFQRFVLEKVKDLYEQHGFNMNGASHLEAYLRTEIAAYACAYGNEECVKAAQDLFEQYMNSTDNSLIDPSLKYRVYCTAIGEGGEMEWIFIFNLYKTATVQTEKRNLLDALSCTKKVWLLNRLLHYALDSSVVRSQDASRVFSRVSSNIVGRSITWDFFRSNWDTIFSTFGGSFSMSGLVSGVTSSFNTEFQLQQLRDFWRQHSNLSSATRSFAQTIEKTMANIKWMEDNYDIVSTWLEKYKI